jgi:hypothetical protein
MNDNEPTVEQRIAFLADEAEMELLRTPTDARLRKRVAALRKLSDDALDKVEELREENG